MVFLLYVVNEDDCFVVESCHKTELGAKLRMAKVAKESDLDDREIEQYFMIEPMALLN